MPSLDPSASVKRDYAVLVQDDRDIAGYSDALIHGRVPSDIVLKGRPSQ
jgi:hypothetical protein